jgi:hypothetical protein
MAVICVSIASRSAWSSVYLWEQRERMAWAALSAGSGDSPFYLHDLVALGDVDAGEFFDQCGALGGALLCGVGFAGGKLLAEQGAAFGAEHPVREKLLDLA